jgi:transcriptional regulator with XRE-family HTH domain
MPKTAGGIVPLDWPALVAETIRRRKEEKMTQREHAALASVSIPTIIAFDRAERTLSLSKAIDILRVVGLVEEASKQGSQEIFARDAFARWRELIKDLPKDSVGRFPAGWFRIDYALEGDIKEIELHKLPELLRQAVVPHTGWPMFWIPRRPELAPQEIDGVIECWLKPGDKGDLDRSFYDAAHCDFWRAAPSGRMMLIRGYQEDTQETFAAGTIFDTTLPIWRIGEAFLHAARLAKLIALNLDKTTIRLRVLYAGLSGRDLRAWASPQSVDYFGGGRSRTDEALLDGNAPADAVRENLAQYVYPMIASLYERFGVAGISISFVESELGRMQGNHFGDYAAESKR